MRHFFYYKTGNVGIQGNIPGTDTGIILIADVSAAYIRKTAVISNVSLVNRRVPAFL